ncbi:alpha/beta hydrolase [Mycobacterium paraense]|uniref:Alpha/beta hydrolase n=1 Tax=Mycobacterium paraense TaxID=767916 RepID=A0ABX3VQT2_9MYCO|nr:alpha/beta fold hydrolase [Mycobacterium paraense]ORW32614.1 alpha/beta hydrolase [Mycobacterium paraense]ORW37962.1 alpha/beta hydrolase [Mycobacterium paraense]
MTQLTTVTAADGVVLAVHTYSGIDPRRPTILAIHGYPDNHHVWDGVAEELGDGYNFVAYDVRGIGESSRPATRSGYQFAHLVGDIGAVIDSLGVGAVHLLGHDWGSIQGWAAVTDESVMGKIASFTSISGPHLNYAGRFLRSPRTPRDVADVVKQFLASGYIWFFLCPGAPELAIRSGATMKVFAAVERIGRPHGAGPRRAATTRSIDDYLNGLNLYRANMPGPILAPPAQLPETRVPVQVLVARQDYFVSPALQRFTGSIPPDNRIVAIDGGHWVVTSHPEVIAQLTSDWVNSVVAFDSPRNSL